MEYAVKQPSGLRIYGYAISFYCFVAFLLLSPVISRQQVSAQVIQQLTVTQQTLNKHAAAPTASVISGRPVQFRIERLNIDFPVALGTYNPVTRGWTLDSNHVFLNSLANPEPLISNSRKFQPTTAVFYAHNFKHVIGKTVDLVPGDILTVTTDNRYTFRYYYTNDAVVQPQDTDILHMPNRTPEVALITCTGAWDQARRIMYFAPLGNPVSTAGKVAMGDAS